MGILTRWRRRKAPYAAHTDEERMSRYVYLLNSLPASVIESAHARAFADLPAARRRELFEQLWPFMADGERHAASDDPTVLAKLFRRAEEHRLRREGGADAAATTTAVDADPRDRVDSRDLLTHTGVMAVVANQFLLSAAVTAYFTVGAGSLGLAGEPAWIGATFDPGGSGWDGGVHDAGSGGGFDGGGFGGLDGGGFDGGGGAF